MYEETREMFKKAKLLDEFDRCAIFLQSNLDMFEEHIDETKNFLDDKITSLPSYKKLLRKQRSDNLDADEKEEKAPAARSDIQGHDARGRRMPAAELHIGLFQPRQGLDNDHIRPSLCAFSPA